MLLELSRGLGCPLCALFESLIGEEGKKFLHLSIF